MLAVFTGVCGIYDNMAESLRLSGYYLHVWIPERDTAIGLLLLVAQTIVLNWKDSLFLLPTFSWSRVFFQNILTHCPQILCHSYMDSKVDMMWSTTQVVTIA